MTDKLAKASFWSINSGDHTWSPEEIDKLEIRGLKEYQKAVNDCRFYYERDPIAATVINKTIEIGVTNLIFDKGSLSENEYRVFLGIEDELQEFAEQCALEFLLSGLVGRPPVGIKVVIEGQRRSVAGRCSIIPRPTPSCSARTRC